MRGIIWAAMALLAATPAAGAESADAAIEAARAACAGWENGELAVEDGAITEIDLTGDGQPETVLDESRLACSSALSLFCGTGGCMVHVFGAPQPYSRLAKGWRVIEWSGDRILLFALHGAECGGTNLRHCYEAVSWSDDGFQSVRPPLE